MKLLGEVLKLAGGYLQEKGNSRPVRDAEDLLAHLLKVKRLDLYMKFDLPLGEEELSAYRALLVRRAKGEPLDYILGEVDFYGCRFTIDPRVLIPRPETELLLEKICAFVASGELKEKVVWDVCTGSGCLGIALKKKFPYLSVALSDLSEGALEVARGNASRNAVEVELFQGDLLAPFAGKKADIVIVNPPYISNEEYGRLDREVSEFEPKMALVSGPSGLEYYERLAQELPKYLNPRARVFFEIGFQQGEKVLSLFNASCWRSRFFERDYSGHDRFFFLEFE